MTRLPPLFAALLLAAPALTSAAGDPAAGRKLFASCANCHAVGPGARSAFGPHLNGLLGRPAGSLPGYSYSAGMKASRLVWTQATLTAFLREPSAVVPGTKMVFAGLPDAQKRADLIAYLQQP